MSTAEQTAWKFYEAYHLEAMPSEVKRHLMILLLSSPHSTGNASYANSNNKDDVADILAEPAPLSWDDVSQRLNQAESDMKAGRTMSCDAVHEQLEQNFPWLCE